TTKLPRRYNTIVVLRQLHRHTFVIRLLQSGLATILLADIEGSLFPNGWYSLACGDYVRKLPAISSQLIPKLILLKAVASRFRLREWFLDIIFALRFTYFFAICAELDELSSVPYKMA